MVSEFWWVVVRHPDGDEAYLAQTPWADPKKVVDWIREHDAVADDTEITVSSQPLPGVAYQAVPPRELGR